VSLFDDGAVEMVGICSMDPATGQTGIRIGVRNVSGTARSMLASDADGSIVAEVTTPTGESLFETTGYLAIYVDTTAGAPMAFRLHSTIAPDRRSCFFSLAHS
jgi:hypothetical protein